MERCLGKRHNRHRARLASCNNEMLSPQRCFLPDVWSLMPALDNFDSGLVLHYNSKIFTEEVLCDKAVLVDHSSLMNASDEGESHYLPT